MKVTNLLNFLNNTTDLYSLNCASCRHELVDFLNILSDDEQFIQKIDLGVVYIKYKTQDQVVIVDGLSRLLSLSLLLHAVCECYKKTTNKNDKAIKTIREKYLISGDKTKLRLPEKEQVIYNKIIFGERLSGNEKESYMFKLLHKFWTQIKQEELQAGKIFNILQKIYIYLVDAGSVPTRDLYYNLNKDNRNIDQLSLINDYLESIGIKRHWDAIFEIYKNNDDLFLFFKDFFITKFSVKNYSKDKLYPIFMNYFETMLQYMSEDTLISKIKRTAKLYNQIINVDIDNETIKKAIINIKMHKGDDTYAYILNIYEDYIDNNITEATFLEILATIDEYLRNRLKTPNNVDFNELINYLNAFITCK